MNLNLCFRPIPRALIKRGLEAAQGLSPLTDIKGRSKHSARRAARAHTPPPRRRRRAGVGAAGQF